MAAQKTESSEAHEEKHKRKKVDHKLDEALEESFPGSDPVSISQPKKSKHDKGPA